ncbi:hypothetical protein [Spongiactinospora sp. TRM90649]|uniref:hypothetical protein n=1 Tax=Spongiactinospora sp. TRM90649 TaxID=3031114 RepID=UPI0023F9D3BB|nr:hypothetical protein [Spongiactinospora sp. TRM90649]MDF5759075.1 hypothetical protein [Spongiactinospora sp. TRM90649]
MACTTGAFAGFVRKAVTGSLTVGVLIGAGWLLAVLLGLFGASPAAADTAMAVSAVPSSAVPSSTVSSSAVPSSSGTQSAEASLNAEAMAGRGVDGLTSQSGPALPTPTTADHNSGADGFVPQSGGGAGQFGPGMGDIARSVFDPRLMVQRAPVASMLPPIVRTAADEPSFSPD